MGSERPAPRACRSSFNLGASVIERWSPRFNLMLEGIWASVGSMEPDGSRSRDEEFTLAPGARLAFNRASGLQTAFRAGP